MKLNQCLTPKAIEYLRDDDNMKGSKSVFSIKAIFPSANKMSKYFVVESIAMVWFLPDVIFSEPLWLEFDESEQIEYLHKFELLPQKDQTAEGGYKLSQTMAARKVGGKWDTECHS